MWDETWTRVWCATTKHAGSTTYSSSWKSWDGPRRQVFSSTTFVGWPAASRSKWRDGYSYGEFRIGRSKNLKSMLAEDQGSCRPGTRRSCRDYPSEAASRPSVYRRHRSAEGLHALYVDELRPTVDVERVVLLPMMTRKSTARMVAACAALVMVACSNEGDTGPSPVDGRR